MKCLTQRRKVAKEIYGTRLRFASLRLCVKPLYVSKLECNCFNTI